MKGISKGFNKYITNIFVVKEEEMQIGCPTDVKHVSHIGFDGSSGSSNPSWMNKFETGPDFQTSSIGAAQSTLSPWSSSQDIDMGQQSTEAPSKPRKLRRKKKKSSSTSSPIAGGVKIKTSRKPKSKLIEGANKELSVH